MRHETSWHPSGRAFTDATVRRINRIVKEGARNADYIKLARSILAGAGVYERDQMGEVRAIHDWVKSNTRYTNDSTEAEVLSSPAEMFKMYRQYGTFVGDCDELVALEGILLRSVGRMTRYATISQATRDPHNRMSHIYHEVLVDGKWVPLDPIMKSRGVGYAPPDYTAKRIYDLGAYMPPVTREERIAQRQARRAQRQASRAQRQASIKMTIEQRTARKAERRAVKATRRAEHQRRRDERRAMKQAVRSGGPPGPAVRYYNPDTAFTAPTPHFLTSSEAQHMSGMQRYSPVGYHPQYQLGFVEQGVFAATAALKAFGKKARRKKKKREARRAARAPGVVAEAAAGNPVNPDTLQRALALVGLPQMPMAPTPEGRQIQAQAVMESPQFSQGQQEPSFMQRFGLPIMIGGGALILLMAVRK